MYKEQIAPTKRAYHLNGNKAEQTWHVWSASRAIQTA